jgi:predicted nucleic acid-binding protein
MGTLSLPKTGRVYVDTAPVIYTVERKPDYEALLQPLWDAMDAQSIEVVSSELTLLETLVKPLKDGAQTLARDYETFLTATRLQLHPITTTILKDAARLRADANLKTPDAIHAATALATGCSQLITNDGDFRKVASLQIVILKDVV